jgi:hypothetical protein
MPRASKTVERLIGVIHSRVEWGDVDEVRALLRAALMNPVPQDELAACGRCRSCKRQRAVDRAVAALLGGK